MYPDKKLTVEVERKAIPVQVMGSPEGSRRLSLLDLKTTGT